MGKHTSTPDASAALPGLKRGNLESIVGESHTYPSEAEARLAFADQREHLLAINTWGELLGSVGAGTHFKLHDPAGHVVIRTPRPGDHVSIHLGPLASVPIRSTTDWTRVEQVIDREDHLELTLRPCADPTADPPQPTVIEHFFTEQASNTFKLQRLGAMLVAVVHGQHEAANTDPRTAGGALKALRNRAVAEQGWGIGTPQPGVGSPDQTLLTGPLGAQRLMWKTFTRSLVTSQKDPPPSGT